MCVQTFTRTYEVPLGRTRRVRLALPWLVLAALGVLALFVGAVVLVVKWWPVSAIVAVGACVLLWPVLALTAADDPE